MAETMVTHDGRQTLLEIARLHDRMATIAERIRDSDLAPHATGGDGWEGLAPRPDILINNSGMCRPDDAE